MSPDAIDAEIPLCDARSSQATPAGAQAFARLLKLAEERDSGQIPRVARFWPRLQCRLPIEIWESNRRGKRGIEQAEAGQRRSAW